MTKSKKEREAYFQRSPTQIAIDRLNKIKRKRPVSKIIEQSWSPANLRGGLGVADRAAGYVDPTSFVGNIFPDSKYQSK